MRLRLIKANHALDPIIVSDARLDSVATLLAAGSVRVTEDNHLHKGAILCPLERKVWVVPLRARSSSAWLEKAETVPSELLYGPWDRFSSHDVSTTTDEQ